MRSRLRVAFALAVAGGALVLADNGGDTTTPHVRVVELEGAIGPASADYFMRALEQGDEDGIDLLVLRLDTPGGLDKSMRDMIKAILASPVPVATYVAPNGSRAASAGTYIMYASHIAAMAPATNIGSSTPVNLGGEGSPLPIPTAPQPPADEGEPGGDESGSKDGQDAEPADKRPSGSAMDRKVVNDAVSYIKGLAELRGRNAEWAEATVREASNLTASEALETNVIDLVAESLTELLEAVDGRTVNAGGVDVTISSKNAHIEFIVPDWRYELLGILTDPNVALILLMIGFYGLVLEFYSPGIGVGAVTGIICLLLGAFALQMLPINYAGLALIIVGIALLVTEAFSPSFGVFGVGGVIAFVVGAIILMDTDLPAYQISKPVIAAVAAVSVGIMVFVLGAAVRARRARSASGKESMLGGRAEVVEDFQGKGRVRAFGEVWQAEGDPDVLFEKDSRVTIAEFDGLTVRVEANQPEGD
ncbi:MAG: nodulation protein NfeD [Gammaproteobacteria bacterium]|nr:nodulation protein NfeD [Gammaproteobacteria bacterium]